MRASALLACLLLGSACGASGDAERLLWPGAWHHASPAELSYAYLAWDLRRAEPCQRIARGALTWIDGEPVSMRSRCLAGVAANLRDPEYCEHVVSVRTLFHDGAGYSRETCLAGAVDPRGTVVGPQADPAGLLEQLGWDEAALAEQCRRAVTRSKSWQQSFVRSVERCAASSPEPECRAHAVRLASSLYFRDADAPCRAFYEVNPAEFGPVPRADPGGHDWPAWYRAKLRSGEFAARLERLPDLSRP